MADNYPKSPSDRPIIIPGVQGYGTPPYQTYPPQYQLNVPGQLSLSSYSGNGYRAEQDQTAFDSPDESRSLEEQQRLQADAEKKKVQSRERVRRFRDRKRKEKEELRAQRAQKAAQQGDLNVRVRRELVKEVVEKFVEVVEGRPPAVAREILQKFLAHSQVKATLRDGAPSAAFLSGRSPDQPIPTPKGRKRKQPIQGAHDQSQEQQQQLYQEQAALHQQQQHLHQQLHQQAGHLGGGAFAPAVDPLGLGLVNGVGAGQSGSVHL